MAKKNALSIDFESLGVEPADVAKVAAVLEKEAPHIKAGMRKIEGEVETAVRAIYEKLASEETEKEDGFFSKVKGLLG